MTDPRTGETAEIFRGLNVMVVEDEAIVSFMIEDMLLDHGCAAVWHASNVSAALAILDAHQPHLAVLDVNLGGELVFPVAKRLEEAGIPFVFATGYGRNGILRDWAHHPIIHKPYDGNTLARALSALLPR
jgi:DNA-binding response OmpR family regulator